MRESDFCLVAVPRDLEQNVRVLPLGHVIDEIEVIVDDVPGNLRVRNKLGNPDRATMNVLKVVFELTQLIGPALNFV
jgi:hypothetical protein